MPVSFSYSYGEIPTPVLLPGKCHGLRSLVGCSPWGRKESDTTEWLHFDFSLSCIGEGNGNLLQYSCLENPRDGGAWWAAVYGVAQSQTWLKWLSSSSSSSICSNSCPLSQWCYSTILSSAAKCYPEWKRHAILSVLQAPLSVQGNHVDSVGVTKGVMLFDSHLDTFIFIYKMVRVGFGLRVERGREIPQVWCVVQKESPEQCGKRFWELWLLNATQFI